jgi:hypothetical protein
MTENIARQPAGILAGGQFAATAHAEPGITLTAQPAYDPRIVARSILDDLRDTQARWGTELANDAIAAMRAGKSTYNKFLDGLIAKNRGGKCSRHEFNAFDTADTCNDCHVAFMVEARTNPKPAPVPRGVIPVRPTPHHLKSEQLSSDSDEDTGVETTVTRKTGDEKFEAAVRRLFEAPDDAAVEVIQEDTEYGTDWTRETSSEITVKCGDREASYNYMGDLMRALDRRKDSPHAMALRFMRATTAERPLLQGVAAVYLYRGEHSDPRPAFGKVQNVYSHGSSPSMLFMHSNGRQEYIQFNEVVAILETDQSSVYDETAGPSEDGPHTPGL